MKTTGAESWMRAEGCGWKQERVALGVMTGHIGITSGSLIKPGKYPSKLDWSLPGDGIGLYMLQKRAQTKLCYCYCPMAKDALITGTKRK